MINLQPVLVPIKGTDVTVSVRTDKEGSEYYVFIGLALLECVPGDPRHVITKMAVARLHNCGHKIKTLSEQFHADPKTIRRWSAALRGGDIDQIARAFAGQGQMPKVTAPMERFILRRYRQLKDVRYNYNALITAEVEACFETTLSRETLRKIFVKECQVSHTVERLPVADAALEHTISTQDHDRADPVENHSSETATAELNSADNGCDIDPQQSENKDVSSSSANHSPSFGGQVPAAKEVDRNAGTQSAADERDGPPAVPRALGRMPYSDQIPPSAPRLVHHAGQILFTPFLDELAVTDAMQRQWLAQILQGAVNIEQTRDLSLCSLAVFAGKVIADRKHQRSALKDQAGIDAVLEVYRANLKLVQLDELLYYDPHTKEYTGQLKVLQGWCGRRHGVGKTMHLDFIHTRSGQPCFVQHYDNFYDLRERFFLTVHVFRQMLAARQERPHTWIIDRGIYGLDTLGEIIEQREHVITWEKDYKTDGWEQDAQTVDFKMLRCRNRADDLREYHFSCQEEQWHRDGRLRRIIVRATNPNGRTVEVAILCSNDQLDVEDVVTAIFSRWVQENDFCYSSKHFGIDEITSYAHARYDEIAHTLNDRQIATQEYREAKRQVSRDERKLSRLLFDREKLSDQLVDERQVFDRDTAIINHRLKATAEHMSGYHDGGDDLPERKRLDQIDELVTDTAKRKKRIARKQARLDRLQSKIETSKAQVVVSTQQLDMMLHTDSRVEMLTAEHYCRLDTRSKALMDALRVTARNVFYRLMELFKPMYDNFRDDHAILRLLTRAPGIIRTEKHALVVELWPRGQLPRRLRRVAKQLLAAVTERINTRFAGCIPVQIKLIEDEFVELLPRR
jgi:hypothetical protein